MWNVKWSDLSGVILRIKQPEKNLTWNNQIEQPEKKKFADKQTQKSRVKKMEMEKYYQVVIYQASVIHLCGKKGCLWVLSGSLPGHRQTPTISRTAGCGRFQRERMKQTAVLLWSLGAVHLQIIVHFKPPAPKSADGFDASVKKLISCGNSIQFSWSLSKEEILFQLTRRWNQRWILAWLEVWVNCRFSHTANLPPNCFLIWAKCC